MRKIIVAVAAAALMIGSLAGAQTASATQNPNGPTIHPLDCRGTTGYMGCGPGWVWDGARCVPC
jgi:hypothetical protein